MVMDTASIENVSQAYKHAKTYRRETTGKWSQKNTNLVLSIDNPVSEDILTKENTSCFTNCASPISMTQRINDGQMSRAQL